jgi:hypothetical protein
MSAPLTVTCIVGGTREDKVFPRWMPGNKAARAVLAFSPQNLNDLRREFPGLLEPVEWEGYQVSLLPLPGAQDRSASQWTSDSICSKALYPSYVNLGSCDIVLQIMPTGVTSEHYHEHENGQAVCEIIAPVYTDGLTRAWMEGEGPPRPFTEPIHIAYGQAHQLIRPSPGFSVHVLKMLSELYRFPDREGHVKCSRLYKQALHT